MSRERGELALWRHIRWLFLHAQTGTKAPGIYGLVRKKDNSSIPHVMCVTSVKLIIYTMEHRILILMWTP